MYFYGPPHIAEQKQDDQPEHTFSGYVRIRDVALKTYQRRWTIGWSGERGSGISVLATRHHDEDDIQGCANISSDTEIFFKNLFVESLPSARFLFVRCTVVELVA